MEETALATLLFKVQDNITAAVRGDIAAAEKGITSRIDELKQQATEQDTRFREHTRADLEAFAGLRSDFARLHAVVEERTAGGLLKLHLTPKQKTALWTIAVSGAGVIVEFIRQFTVWLAGRGSVHP